MTFAPVTVGIPAVSTTRRLVEGLQHLAECDPFPSEVIIHIDGSNAELEAQLIAGFPSLRIISTPICVGPGGGRHRCIQAATQPFFASFDDDSWPIDRDFFEEVVNLFARHSKAAVLAASIYHRHEAQPQRLPDVSVVTDYTGCGHAIRVSDYLQIVGYIDRPCAYGVEEVDVAMQLHAIDRAILSCRSLRVFHDTRLAHHSNPSVVASTVQNVALRAFLRYPARLWPRATLQLGNAVLGMIKRKRFSGLAKGVFGIPGTLHRYASFRKQLPAAKIRSYLNARPKTT